MAEYILMGLFLLVLFVFTYASFYIIREGEVAIIERLGVYYKTIDQPGFQFKFAFMEKSILLSKKQHMHTEPKKFITKDNQELAIYLHLDMTLLDPKLYHYGVKDINEAIQNLSNTILMEQIQRYTLEEFATEYITIKEEFSSSFAEKVAAWGLSPKDVALEKVIIK